ncbi:MAG: SRPBCC domain-containing protein [Pyrinomonadaceae bacterium]
MFKIRAGYTDKVEVNSDLEKVREFFSDIKNFIELMPNIESIHTDNRGITHWKIRAEIPFFGSFSQKFSVEIAEDSDERMEWLPVRGETKNLLRYSVDYAELDENLTFVQFSQTVELRRNSAMELHLLAPLAGEAVISSEMTKRVADMIKLFVERARNRLEKNED